MGALTTKNWRMAGMLFFLFFCVGLGFPQQGAAGPYVGSKACAECHEAEYTQFTTHSKKARSWKSVSVMASDLTKEELEGCYECHTTGYGKGGFVSYETTPHLADVGCETCHGPGAAHVESGGDPASISRRPSIENCGGCHNESRVGTFGYKPLIYSGGH